MNGAYNIEDATRTVYPPSTQHNLSSSSDPPQTERRSVVPSGEGALATADKALNQILGSAGFVDIAAPFAQNYVAHLHYLPIQEEAEELKAGALSGLIAYVKSLMAADPAQSEQAQAGIEPQAAVRLLT